MTDWNLEAPWIGREPEYAEPEKELRAKKIRVTKEQTEGMKEEICDHFCKWPYEFKDPEDLWNDKCDDCIVMEFLDEVIKKCLKPE